MSALTCWTAGWRRVARSPVLVLALWLATVAVTVPPALALRSEIQAHLGDSLAADAAADRVNYDWWQEFGTTASPLGQSLRTDVIGFAAVMDNTSALADGTRRAVPVVMAGALFVLLVWFLTPGLICRMATGDPNGRRGLLAVSGAFATRMLRLSLVTSVIYAVLFGGVHAWLFDDLFERATHDVTAERTAFFIRLALYAAFFALVAFVNLIVDMAKVRLVVEDRHSVFAALAAGARFVRANRAVSVGVYLLNVATLGAVIAAYALVAPGAVTGMWLAFIVGQAFIAGRVAVKLAFWAGAIDVLQRRFGCQGVVRAGWSG